MASIGVNVFRYSALGVGVAYGFTHQKGLNSASRAAQEKHEYDHKEHQIEEAKKAWQNKINPPKSEGVIPGPETPQFDFEKWVDQQAKA